MPGDFIEDAPETTGKFVDDTNQFVEDQPSARPVPDVMRGTQPATPKPSTLSRLIPSPATLAVGPAAPLNAAITQLTGTDVAGKAMPTVGHGLLDAANAFWQVPAEQIAKANLLQNKAQTAFNEKASDLLGLAPTTRARLGETTQAVGQMWKDVIDYNQSAYDKVQKDLINAGAPLNDPAVKTAKFMGSTVGTIARYIGLGNLAGPAMTAEAFIDKAYQGIDEGQGAFKSFIAGNMAAAPAAAIASIPGADKAYDAVWKMLLAKGIKGTGFGLTFGLTDAGIDKFIYNKMIGAKDLADRLGSSVVNMLGFELAGAPASMKNIHDARDVARTYATPEDARAEILPDLADKLNSYAETVGRGGDAKTPEARDLKGQIEDLQKQSLAVTYAEKAKMDFTGKPRPKFIEELAPEAPQVPAIRPFEPEEVPAPPPPGSIAAEIGRPTRGQMRQMLAGDPWLQAHLAEQGHKILREPTPTPEQPSPGELYAQSVLERYGRMQNAYGEPIGPEPAPAITPDVFSRVHGVLTGELEAVQQRYADQVRSMRNDYEDVLRGRAQGATPAEKAKGQQAEEKFLDLQDARDASIDRINKQINHLGQQAGLSEEQINALQEQRTAQEVSRPGAAGENLPEGGAGIRPGEQGEETARAREAEAQVAQEEPVARPEFKSQVDIVDNTSYQGKRQGSLMGANDEHLVARDPETGKDIGRLWLTKTPAGFEVRKVETDPSARGKDVATQLYFEARERYGPYAGNTDFTEAGRAFNERLREKYPQLFTPDQPIAPEMQGSIVADSLGGQQIYEMALKKMGLGPDATIGEISKNISDRIGKLGSTIRETSLKIFSKMKDLGRTFADRMAEVLHGLNPFQGRKGEIGAAYLGKRPPEMPPPPEYDEYAGLPSRWNRPIGQAEPPPVPEPPSVPILNPMIPRPIRRAAMELGGTPDLLKASENINAKVRAGQTIDLTPKTGSPRDMHQTLDQFAATMNMLVTGRGATNENGTPIMVKPFINTDPGKIQPIRDLTGVESKLEKIFSPTHVLTGAYGPGIGALQRGELPQVDMTLGNAASFTNQTRYKNHFLDVMADAGLNNNSSAIRKEMQPARDEFYRLMAEASRLKDVQTRNPSENTSIRLNQLEPAIKSALDRVYQSMQGVAEKYGDARVIIRAEFWDGAPEWLKPLMTPKEEAAAAQVHDMMLEMKKGLKESNVPVIESRAFMPHQVKEGLSKDVATALDKSKLKAWGTLGIEGRDVDPDYIRFAHRNGMGLMTLPDLFGAMDKYITKASNLQAKQVVARKWMDFADLNQAQTPRLADKIRSDMKDYIDPAKRITWLDNINQVFMSKLIGFNPGTAFKHMPKILLSVAEMGTVDSFKGLTSVIEGKAKGVAQYKDIMATVDAIKGSRYFESVELGTGDISADRLKAMTQKFKSASHQPVQFVESRERDLVLYTSLIKGYKDGLSPEDAIHQAISNSAMVNFIGVDKAPILRGSTAQSVFFLQNTPWKLMELQLRRAGDLYKGTKGMIESGGLSNMDPEMRRRFGASLRNAAIISSVIGLDKYLDTDITAWMMHAPGVVKALIEQPAKELWKSITDEDHEFHFDPAEALYNGVTAAPLVDSALKGFSKYGNSPAFWADQLTPNFAKNLFMEPTQPEALGEGIFERNIRAITGQPKASMKEEMADVYENRQRRRQAKATAKYGNRWTANPIK